MATNESITTNVTTPEVAGGSGTHDYAGYVFVPLFLVIGVIGNALTVRVMLTKGFRSMPVSKVLIALSLADTVVNIMLPFNKPFMRQLIHVDIRALSAGGCKLFYWAYRFFKFSAAWFVVLISLERFVAVWLHTKAKAINTIRNAYIAIGAVIAFWAVYIGYWAAQTDVILFGKCIPNKSPPELAETMRVVIIFGTLMYVTVPAILLIILNAMIVFKLVAVKRKRNAHVMPTTGNDKNTRSNDGSSKTNAMLIGVALAFIVLETPIGILHVVAMDRNISLFETKDPVLATTREVAQIMEQLNHSINFLLYVLSSKRFRDRVVALCSRRNRTVLEEEFSVTQETKTSHLKA